MNKKTPSFTQSSTPSNEDQQFEVELCWCIQQLQNALQRNLNPKQSNDHRKVLNILMNNKTSKIQKRQAMRASFGDYRFKMVSEEAKLAKRLTDIKLVKEAKPSKKSQFLRKSDNTFRFNFDMKNLRENQVIKEENSTVKSMKFTPSNNEFRFNFGQEDGTKVC